MKKGQAIIEVVNGVEGPSLYIGDEDGGHRLAGPKPWGGGKTVFKFTVDVAELQEEAARYAKTKQHEYVVSHNQDDTFSVALPDGEELRIVPPQRTWVGLTDEEFTRVQQETPYTQFMTASQYATQCQIRHEAKLKEKNT